MEPFIVSSHWNASLIGRMATDMALLSREQMKATAVAREMRVMASIERGAGVAVVVGEEEVSC